jgi:hypothetical protein
LLINVHKIKEYEIGITIQTVKHSRYNYLVNIFKRRNKMNSKKIICEKCKYYFNNNERKIPLMFFEGVGDIIDLCNDIGLEQCHHDVCFVTKNHKERIKGFYQLNKDNDCIYFKKQSFISIIKSLFNLSS